MIDKKVVLHIAELSYLEFSQQKLHQFIKELDAIVTYINKLKELDTNEELSYIGHLQGRSVKLQEDIPLMSSKEFCILRSAPQICDSYFMVPKVVER